MNRKFAVLLLLSALALSCGPLGALRKPAELQQTAEALVGTVEAVITEAPELKETVAAAITEAPELKKTVEAAVTEAPDLLKTVEAALTETPVELEPTAASSGSGGALRQWAAIASASSEYGNPSWSAQQATGAPDTPTCGDEVTAWASASSGTVEWIEVTFARSVIPTQLTIYQTYHPDQVVKVELIDITAGYHEVYSAQPVDRSSEPCPYILTIPVETDLEVGGLRITIDQSVVGSWNEIDAVELVGQPVGG